MRTPKLGLLIATILVAGVFVALVPTASAQQSSSITVVLNPPSDNVKPLQGPVTISGTVTLQTDQSAVTGVIGVPVTYTVTKQPAWATVLVSPASDVFPIGGGAPSGPSASIPRTITVTVTASDQAPAFQADQIEITATTTPPAPGKPQTGKGNVPITAGYFSIIDVQLAEAIKVERPQTPVQFPVKVSNFGNANTKVTFTVGEGTSPTLQVPVPNPVTLQSKQAGGNQISADIPLTIQTPYKNGYMNEVGIVNYKLTSAYALDPKVKGDESQISVLVTTRGFYVPGPSPILFVGLIGIAALLFGRRRL